MSTDIQALKIEAQKQQEAWRGREPGKGGPHLNILPSDMQALIERVQAAEGRFIDMKRRLHSCFGNPDSTSPVEVALAEIERLVELDSSRGAELGRLQPLEAEYDAALEHEQALAASLERAEKAERERDEVDKHLADRDEFFATAKRNWHAVHAERDALAAHVQQLTDLLERAQHAWATDYWDLNEEIDAVTYNAPETSLALRDAEVAKMAYAAGFAVSIQGYNASWPFESGDFVEDTTWCEKRDEWIHREVGGGVS